MDYYDRNTVWGFSHRVLANLKYLNSVPNTGADVHVVTELITSLLGLIVFPYEEIRRSGYTHFDKYRLDDLVKEGWPKWTFDISSSDNLKDLMKHLRNAVSHRRVYFSSDSPNLSDVVIHFRDRPKPKEDDNWGATINAVDLQGFVLKLANFLKEWEQDYS